MSQVWTGQSTELASISSQADPMNFTSHLESITLGYKAIQGSSQAKGELVVAAQKSSQKWFCARSAWVICNICYRVYVVTWFFFKASLVFH